MYLPHDIGETVARSSAQPPLDPPEGLQECRFPGSSPRASDVASGRGAWDLEFLASPQVMLLPLTVPKEDQLRSLRISWGAVVMAVLRAALAPVNSASTAEDCAEAPRKHLVKFPQGLAQEKGTTMLLSFSLTTRSSCSQCFPLKENKTPAQRPSSWVKKGRERSYYWPAAAFAANSKTTRICRGIRKAVNVYLLTRSCSKHLLCAKHSARDPAKAETGPCS